MMLGMLGGAGSLLSGAGLMKMGMMAASAAGMYLLNGKKDKGEVARLDDTKVSSSSYGRGIPLVFGTMRVTGNMFWATDFEETLRYMDPKQKGGKKGEKKGTPYYEYHANFAMCLCEGPVEEILRIWADSNLIYDKHNPKNKDLVSVGFSRAESGGGKSGMGMSKKKGGDGGDSGRFKFRFYSGTEEQMPDPFMVKKQGKDKVPAHRGMSYLFFEHFKLEDFGNRTPTITAEVSVRKKAQIAYTTMTNLPNPTGLEYLGGLTYIDVERMKLYQDEYDRPRNERLLRIYDLSTDKEIKRIYATDINKVNANHPSYPKEFFHPRFIGIAGNGDIVVGLLGANSDVIAFIDPNSLVMKKKFGTRSSYLENGPHSIVHVTQAVPISYIHISISISGEVEVTPKRATLLVSFGGWFYIFSEDHQPLNYFTLPGGYTTNMGPATPIKADIFGGEFVIVSNVNTGQFSRLWRVKWSLKTVNIAGADVIEPGVPANVDAKVIREIVYPGGAQFNFITRVQYIAGAEQIVWFEELRWTDTLKKGLWVCAIAQDDPDAKIVWRHRVSDDYSVNGPGGMLPIPINTSNGTKWIDNTNVWEVNVAAKTVSYYGTGNTFPSMLELQTYWPARGAIIVMLWEPKPGGGSERKWAMLLLDRNAQTPVSVGTIISDLANRVSIPPEKVDLAKLKPDEIMGYIIENPTSARRVVEELAQIFMFDVVESDYRLKVISRGQQSLVTVPQKDLAIIETETQDYYSETRSQEIDLPQTVVVSYINAEKDYQVNSQHYRRPRSPMQTMQSRDKLEINLAMAMDKTYAKRLAHKVCMSLWTERISYETMLPWKYMKYDPADVMRFEMDDGLVFETRMMKMDLGANYSIECSGIAQTSASYVSNAVAQDDGGVIPEFRPIPPQSDAHILDIPYLEDADSAGNAQFSYYYGAAAFGPGLRGAAIEYRLPGREWDFVGLTTQELVWGQVALPVPPPPYGPYATDDKTVIQLLPTHAFEDASGYTHAWESIPPSKWPSTDNCIVIGREIIYFRDVEITGNGDIKISHLIRGARGTEDAAYRHEPLERFCINTDGLRRADAAFAFVNQLWMFRSFSGYSLFPPHRYDTFLTGASHKPYAPTDFKRAVSGTNINISWQRRTRLGGAMVGGTGTVPNHEETISFELYILSAPYHPNFFDPANPSTYKRKVTTSSTSFNYTSAQRTTDGILATNPIYVVAFQVSANVGRGFPGYATLYPSILT